MGRSFCFAVLAFAGLFLLPDAAISQQSQLFAEVLNASPRSLAMGGAGVALHWDDPFGPHLNPAHLADVRGILWGYGHGQSDPADYIVGNELQAHELEARNTSVLLGMGGFGFEFSGRPISGLGGERYEPRGLDADDFRSRSFGFGARGIQTLRGLFMFLTGGDLPAVQDYVDLYAGARWKRIETARPPISGDGSMQKARARDEGLLLRVTPYHNFTGDWRHERVQDGGGFAAVGGLAVDLYAGASRTNQNFTRQPDGTLVDVSYTRRGVGLHLRTGVPRFVAGDPDSAPSMKSRLLGRLASLQATYETGPTVGPYPTARADADGVVSVKRLGAELGVFDVLYVRIGREKRLESAGPSGAEAQYESRGTTGFGLRLHYGDGLGIYYDRASRPQGSLQNPWSLSFKLDPYVLVGTLMQGRQPTKKR